MEEPVQMPWDKKANDEPLAASLDFQRPVHFPKIWGNSSSLHLGVLASPLAELTIPDFQANAFVTLWKNYYVMEENIFLC